MMLFNFSIFANSLKKISISKNWNLKDFNNNHFIATDSEQKIYVVKWDKTNTALKLDSTNEKSMRLDKTEFSQDGKFILVEFKDISKSTKLALFDVEKGLRLQESAQFKGDVESFWLDSCRYALLEILAKKQPKVHIFSVPFLKENNCHPKKSVDPSLKIKSELRHLWSDDSFNVWSMDSNGKYNLVNWIGKGQFFDFRIGPKSFFWFRESSVAALIFRADLANKKIQPLTSLNHYVAHHSKPLVYGVRDRELIELSLDSNFKTQENKLLKLPEKFKVQSLFWVKENERLFIRDKTGDYWEYIF